MPTAMRIETIKKAREVCHFAKKTTAIVNKEFYIKYILGNRNKEGKKEGFFHAIPKRGGPTQLPLII